MTRQSAAKTMTEVESAAFQLAASLEKLCDRLWRDDGYTPEEFVKQACRLTVQARIRALDTSIGDSFSSLEIDTATD